MNIDLTNKNALVCGSTQGIGKNIALGLAKAGANIILLARNKEKLEHVLNELDKSKNQKHSYISVDMNENEQLAAKLSELSLNIDILINNNGGPNPGKAIDANIDDYLTAFKSHLINFQILVKHFTPQMKTNGFGRIVNIISTSVKQPLPNLGVSNTIRGAVANWSKTIAYELAAYGITVNNILPGATNTERLQQIINNKSTKFNISKAEVEKEMLSEIPMKRFASPDEIANAAVFLSSNEAAYITGTNIVVDGGRTLCL